MQKKLRRQIKKLKANQQRASVEKENVADFMKGKVGIGLRRDIADEILSSDLLQPDFIEFAPENWMGIGGYWNKIKEKAVAKYPVTCHGLSLSLGSPEELDWDFIRDLKIFLDENKIEVYSEHLSYTKSNNAHLYDLLPIPFRQDAVDHVSDRIKQVQDYLGRKIAIENVSYYTPVAAEMTEVEFVAKIVEKADCHLLLDVNNVYVNSFNHSYDAKEFIDKMPLEKVAYIHMAGHEKVAEDLIIDTHGKAIIDPVFELFEYTISKMDPVPVLLERDYNFEDLESISKEMEQLRSIIKKNWKLSHETAI
jgi:uncharacterized protein (UPF0276 family)